MSKTTILIVDDDDVLGQILTRVLTQQGYQVERATDAAQAMEVARAHPPQLALLDLCLPDQDGVELARKLQQQAGNLPLILMTAYPLSLRENPERLEGFSKVLTKPLNLQELRQAVDAALDGEKSPAVPREPEPEPFPAAVPAAAPNEPDKPTEEVREVLSEARQPPSVRRWLPWAAAVAALVLVGAGVVLGMHYLGGGPGRPVAAGEPKLSASYDPQYPGSIVVPPDVQRSVGVQTELARQATERQPLELRGSLDLDPNHLQRIHSRFPGEVVELGQVAAGTGEFATVPHTIRFGDRVKKGQLLCVVWCKDLGEKKNELVDALSHLRLDRDVLDASEKLYQQGALPELQYRQAKQAVESDLNAVARVENTLRVWRVTEKEIDELRKEAERIGKNGGRRDPDQARNWARVEVTAPFDGQIVEKNATNSLIVDTTTDLFTLANLNVLTVWVHVYEEDLPRLLALPRDQRRWKVRITADPTAPPIPGSIETIAPTIDPNQHTALVTGRLDNPNDSLRAGQFIAATVDLPPPPEVVSIPIDALVETGDESVVFVQPDPKADRFTQRHVLVVQRREDHALIRWVKPEWVLLGLLAPPAAPANVAAGTLCELPSTEPAVRVVTSGALEMKATLDDLRSKQSDK